MHYLVTGAASGIGRATATALAAQGAEGLFLVDRNSAALDEAANALASTGANISAFVADLAQPESGDRIIDAAKQYLPSLSGVVSNAGIVTGGSLSDTTLDDFERVFAINVRATWLLAKAARPLLKASKGAIVATASISAEHSVPNVGPYPASKAALVALCQQLALEWAPDGIRVNCVAPGTTETPMTAPGLANADVRASRETSIPVGRVGRPEDIAAVIAFLLSPQASFVNGVNWLVDGGQAISLFYNKAGAVKRD